MKFRWLGLCVVVVLAAVPAQAEKPFDEGALLGTYAFTEIHVRMASGVPVHCSGYGTMTFFGDGEVYLDKYERCSDDGTVKHEAEDFIYEMDVEPFFFLMSASGAADVIQCQLLQKGTMIICDGTRRVPEELSLHAVAVKQ